MWCQFRLVESGACLLQRAKDRSICNQDFQGSQGSRIELTLDRDTCSGSLLESSPAVAEHLVGGVAAGGPHHAAARVRGAATKIKPGHRSAVVAPAGDRTQAEELMQRHRSLENVPARQSVGALEING